MYAYRIKFIISETSTFTHCNIYEYSILHTIITIRAKATFRERWCFTERRDPTKIGPRAIRNRLKYVTAIPSGVAASRPVRLDALETLSTMVRF